MFSFVSYMHRKECIGQDCFLWFSKKYSVYVFLTMTMFVTSQSFISLPRFMFVSAAVSEIHDLNQNKKKKTAIFTFLRHITDPLFMRVTFLYTKLARSLVRHKLKLIITRIMLANQGHPYIHSNTVLCDSVPNPEISGQLALSPYVKKYVRGYFSATVLGHW